MTTEQHTVLKNHLFPGDGFEAVAFALCGRAGNAKHEVLLLNEVVVIPYSDCFVRTPIQVKWSTDSLPVILGRAAQKGWGLIKIHSHPTGLGVFSETDEISDKELFPSIHGWLDSDRPHISAVMLPNGRIIARAFAADRGFIAVDSILEVGSVIRRLDYGYDRESTPRSTATTRTAQALGEGTIDLLKGLSVGVVGCSGTGSWVVEMLARLGIGELVLVDPEPVETVNLNRIVHSTVDDATHARPKVEVLARAVRASGLPVAVEPIEASVFQPSVIRRLSVCDIIFGCVDSIDARDLLTRLATFYLLPYFDVGVRLIADGAGGISHIAGAAHYFHPESPSLMERGVYTAKQLTEEGLRKTDPDSFRAQVDAGYIQGVSEARPAVASINAFYAGLVVNEMLAKLHPYREELAPLGVIMSLTQLRIVLPEDGPAVSGLRKWIGAGDSVPLLGMPVLTEC